MKTSSQALSAVGFTVKSGWAAVVLLTIAGRTPRVVASRRIELSDPKVPDSRQPYHDGFGTARKEGAALSRLLDSVQSFGRRSVISALADLDWEGGALDEAAELYRIAANIESFHERLYQTWFVLCRRTRRAQQALSYLQDRFARFGRFSDQPALTLAWAWQEMEQPARAREVLQEAMRLRPDAGALPLRAARLLADIGEAAIGESLLDSARGRVRENDWLRARDEMAESRSDAATALRNARDLLAIAAVLLY